MVLGMPAARKGATASGAGRNSGAGIGFITGSGGAGAVLKLFV